MVHKQPAIAQPDSPRVKVRISMLVDDALLDRIDDAARRLGISRSAFLCMAAVKEMGR